MAFPNAVKYNGVNYKAHQAFNVDDKDVAELKKKGGWSVQEPESVKEVATEAEEKPAPKTPKKKASKDKE